MPYCLETINMAHLFNQQHHDQEISNYHHVSAASLEGADLSVKAEEIDSTKYQGQLPFADHASQIGEQHT